jgi:hypothetical protein
VAISLAGHGLQGPLVPTSAALDKFPTSKISAIGADYLVEFAIGSPF